MTKEMWIRIIMVIGLILAFILLILIVTYDVNHTYIDDTTAQVENKNG